MILYLQKNILAFLLSKQVISDIYFTRKIKCLLIKSVKIKMTLLNKLRISYRFHFFSQNSNL